MATQADTIEQVKARVEQIEPEQAREEIEGGDAVLIDTRDAIEHEEAHIEGAELIPPHQVAERIEEVVPDRSARVILYCALGQPLRPRRRRARPASGTRTSPPSPAASRSGRPRAFRS